MVLSKYRRRTFADSLALQYLQNTIFRNRSLQNAYNHMQNVNRASINAGFHQWATSAGISQRARAALYKALNVKTKKDFLETMGAVFDAFNATSIPDAPYAMLVELESPYAANIYSRKRPRPGNPTFAPKSSAWLAAVALRRLRKPPAMIIPVYHGIGLGIPVLAHGLLAEALQKGIRQFVHIDDAMYSGLQKSEIVGLMNESLYTLGQPNNQTPLLWIGAAYATPASTRAVLHGWKKHVRAAVRKNPPLRLQLYAAGAIAPPALPILVRAELWRKQQRPGPTMTVLPYKVPNSVSFGPAALSATLANTVTSRPVYKKRRYMSGSARASPRASPRASAWASARASPRASPRDSTQGWAPPRR
jgi:hypothetical protein